MNRMLAKLGLQHKQGVTPGLIGLDFSLERLNMVQLERRGDGEVAVRSWISAPYPEPRESLLENPQLKKFIKRSMSGVDFYGNKVVTLLPSQQQKILSVNYQSEAGHSDTDTILKLLEDRLPEKLNDYVIDYLPVRSEVNENKRHAVVVAAPEKDVVDYLERLNGCGLQVDALEVGPAAIKRLVSSHSRPSDGVNVLVINFGLDVSYLTIISGRRLLFDKQIEFSETGVLSHIASALDLPAQHIKRLINQNDTLCDSDNKDKAPLPLQASQQRLLHTEVKQTLREMMLAQFLPMIEEIKRTLPCSCIKNSC